VERKQGFLGIYLMAGEELLKTTSFYTKLDKTYVPGQTVVSQWCLAGWQTPAQHPWWSHAQTAAE